MQLHRRSGGWELSAVGSEDSKAGWDAAALASSRIFGGGVMGHVSRTGWPGRESSMSRDSESNISGFTGTCTPGTVGVWVMKATI